MKARVLKDPQWATSEYQEAEMFGGQSVGGNGERICVLSLGL